MADQGGAADNAYRSSLEPTLALAEEPQEWQRLLDQLRDEFLLREDELKLLHQIDLRLLASERPLQATFIFVVEELRRILRCEIGSILLRRGASLETTYSSGFVDSGQRVRIDKSIVGLCISRQESICIGELNQIHSRIDTSR